MSRSTYYRFTYFCPKKKEGARSKRNYYSLNDAHTAARDQAKKIKGDIYVETTGGTPVCTVPPGFGPAKWHDGF